jgi:hypothetical protein
MDQNKKSYLGLLKKQKKEKDWDAMLVSAHDAIEAYPNVKVFWRRLHFAQSHYVNEKLNSDLVHELEHKEDYSALLQVYQRLRLVFPESRKLMKRTKSAQKAKDKQTEKDQKDVLVQAEARIASLMKDGQMDTALTSCYEILSYLPSHKGTLRVKDKILVKRDKQISKELGSVINKSYKVTREEYKADKKSVIRI